jgi:hypothetical protein
MSDVGTGLLYTEYVCVLVEVIEVLPITGLPTVQTAEVICRSVRATAEH